MANHKPRRGKNEDKHSRKVREVRSLTDMTAVVLARHFDVTMIPQMPVEVLELVQKNMPRELQIHHFGVYKEWHPNGKLRKLQHYKEGKEHGVCLKWWPNGKLWHKKECINGELLGQRQLWYKNGQLKWNASYSASNKVHGSCTWYHANGQLRSKAQYKNDQLHGEYRFWTKSGRVNSQGFYLWGHKFENNSVWANIVLLPARLLA